MAKLIRRRDFLALTAAGLASPVLARPREAAASSQHPASFPEPGLWNYATKPVKVQNPGFKPKRIWCESTDWAFDGFGGSTHPNAVAHGWLEPGRPSEAAPYSCTIDYGVPAAISKFLHYYYIPQVKDYRTDPLMLSCAFASLNVYRSDNGKDWKLAERIRGAETGWPQVFTLSQPRAARHYKLEITGLVEGADGIRTYEIESYTGPAIHHPVVETSAIKAGEPCTISGSIVSAGGRTGLSVVVVPAGETGQRSARAKVQSGGRFSLSVVPLAAGTLPVTLELKDPAGTVLDRRAIRFQASPRVVVSGVKAANGGIMGRVVNTGARPVVAKIAYGESASKLPKLAPGERGEFHLLDHLHAQGQYLAELAVTENGNVSSMWAFPVERTKSALQGELSGKEIQASWSAEGEAIHLDLAPAGAQATIRTQLGLEIGGSAASVCGVERREDRSAFWSRQRDGWLESTVTPSGSGVQLAMRWLKEGIQRGTEPAVIEVRLRAAGTRFRFVPEYVYSKEPASHFSGPYGDESLVQGAWFAPTRMAALETGEGSVALVPDHDRCLMGIDVNDAVVRMRLGAEPATIKIPAVSGSWQDCFQYVVRRIYNFTEPRQFAPLTKIVMERAKYLTHNQENWSRKMQVLTSFPNQDFVFVFYGLTYTIPALYSWHLMSGDSQAGDRARKCVRWLTDYPGVRMMEGPTAGAFFSEFVSPEIKSSGKTNSDWLAEFHKIPLENPGIDQAKNRWLEPHGTGAACWTLLDYYLADGKRDARSLEVAREGLDWLLKIQNAAGGWYYAYYPDGTLVTTKEDAGNIWNIWALYRFGKLSGDERYLRAAERGKQWFAKKFIADHICRGYWEDVSGSKGKIQLSWEAYEFAIAANAFAEMQDEHLAIQAAGNAATWIWTRVIDCREYFNSYGHVDEQWGWPPATYLSPMFGLAAQTAYRLGGGDLFRDFSGAAKTIGWWTVRETPQGRWPADSTAEDVGGSFWPLEATKFVPLDGPLTPTYWVDWISSQQFTLCLRWLINEVNIRTGGKVEVDQHTLRGVIMGKPGRVSLRPEDVSVEAKHQQVNWLGYATEDSKVLAIVNHDAAVEAKLHFPPPRAESYQVLVRTENGNWKEENRMQGNPLAIHLPARGCALIEWK